ncbi:MAG: glycine--tRNA ligase subunit beta [Burkholderiales bacterium]
MSATLLVELSTEELPPKALRTLGEAFASGIFTSLQASGLLETGSAVRAFATPRRLAATISRVQDAGVNRQETRKLMPAKIAYGADGKPGAALLKKLEKEGGTLAELTRKSEGAEEYVFLQRTIPGATLVTGLQAAVESAIDGLPIPKVMGYQLADGTTTVQFVRPAHGLVALHGEEIVAISALGLQAGRTLHGHRFQGNRDIILVRADEYETKLGAEGGVIADFDARKAAIARQLDELAGSLKVSLGPQEHVTPLLDEVTALVEFPSVYVGTFETEYLSVPQECLILTMRQNQKYFPLFDAAGKLVNQFLIVSNMKLADSRNIVEGNQRVVRPRLADARFFFETDKKIRLAERTPGLASVVYHKELGSQLARVERIRDIAKVIAQDIGCDPGLCDRAAWLAKADLQTNMVGEFPELQGTMGRYYALFDGEDERVASAIEDHYKPRFAGDELPGNEIGVAVALAEKLDALVGLFGIGQLPTGDKDPYGLRRQALGVIRMLIEKNLQIGLGRIVGHAANTARASRQAERAESRLKKLAAGSQEKTAAQGPESFPPTDDAVAKLIEFMYERLKGVLRDGGYTPQEIDAVTALRPEFLADVPGRLAAVRAFAGLPEAQSLAAANKRVANILRQAEAKGETFDQASVAGSEKAERELFDALHHASGRAVPLLEKGDYTGYLKTFAVLKTPVDVFFETVMVMAEDKVLRQNRLALLRDLRNAMNRIADLSKLAA